MSIDEDFAQPLMKQKRNIVDRRFHARSVFGHSPTLGLPFSSMWGVVSKELPFTQQLIIGTHTPPTPKTQLVGSNINSFGVTNWFNINLKGLIAGN